MRMREREGKPSEGNHDHCSIIVASSSLTDEDHEEAAPQDDRVEPLAVEEEGREGPHHEHDEERPEDHLAHPEHLGAELLREE